jgi:hypothetical protein
MSKMVIEVPDQLVEVGKAMAEHLALLQRTVDRLSGGEGGGLCSGGSGDRGRGVQDGVGSPRRHLEESGYRCSSSGDGRGSVHASGTVRAGVPHDDGFGIGGAILVPAIGRAGWTAWGPGGGCG